MNRQLPGLLVTGVDANLITRFLGKCLLKSQQVLAKVPSLHVSNPNAQPVKV